MRITFTKTNISVHYTKVVLEFFIYFPPKNNVIIFYYRIGWTKCYM